MSDNIRLQLSEGKMTRFLIALLLALSVSAQTYVGTATFRGRLDAAAATSTSPFKIGASLPPTCTTGEMFFHSGAAIGRQVYTCYATNSWVATSSWEVASNDIVFPNNPGNVLVPNGNVAIGGASATDRLHVQNGGIRLQSSGVGYMTFGDTAAYRLLNIQSPTVVGNNYKRGIIGNSIAWNVANGNWDLFNNDGGDFAMMAFESGGNVEFYQGTGITQPTASTDANLNLYRRFKLSSGGNFYALAHNNVSGVSTGNPIAGTPVSGHYFTHAPGQWGVNIARSQNANVFSHLSFYRNRSDDPTVVASLQNGDGVGRISFWGPDATTPTPQVLTLADIAVTAESVGAGSVGTSFTFNSNGAERLRLHSDGHTYVRGNLLVHGGSGQMVGIGTSNPASPLHVIQSGALPAVTVSSGTNPHVLVTDNTVRTKLQTVNGDHGLVGTDSNHSFAVYTNNTSRIYVSQAGEVGIGNSSPVARLTVTGDISATGNIELKQVSSVLKFGDGTTATTALPYSGDGRIQVTGSVISLDTSDVHLWSSASANPTANCTAGNERYLHTGTGEEWYCSATNTWSRLPRASAATTYTAGAKQSFVASATTAGANIGASALPSGPATGDLAIDSGDSNRLKWYNGTAWQAAGGSGVGDVLGASNLTTAGRAVKVASSGTVTEDSSLVFGTGLLTYTGGNIEIKPASQAGFLAYSSDQLVISNLFSVTATGKGYTGTQTNHPFVIRTNDADRVTILAGGDVGVGNTSPSYKLDVSGTTRTTGLIVPAAALPGSPATGQIAVDSGASNALKWYDGSAWQSAGGSGGSFDYDPASTIFQVEEFIGASTTTERIGALGWATSLGTGATFTLPTGQGYGVARLGTGSTAGTTAVIYLGAARTGVDPAGTFDLRFRVRQVQVDADHAVRFGLNCSTSVTSANFQPTDGLYIESLGGETSWYGVARSGGTETRSTALGTNTANTWYKLRIRRIDSSTIGFTLNSGTEQTVTTNIPTDVCAITIANNNGTAASNRQLDVDYMWLKVTGLSR